MREVSRGKGRFLCRFCQFCVGGAGYGTIEVLWRGYTHISMIIVGGICFCMLFRLSGTPMPFALKCLTGGLLITAAEFVAGCVVNLWLRLEVWDYSAEPGQLMGQICMRFTVFWCGLSALVIPLCRCVRGLSAARLRGFPRRATPAELHSTAE